MTPEEQTAMQAQEGLTPEQQAVLFGQIIKALGDLMAGENQPKPQFIKIHPRLYEQLVPAEVRFDGATPVQCFTIPLEPEPGVPYGTFVFESRKTGIIRGH